MAKVKKPAAPASSPDKPTGKILYLITQSELGGAQRYVFDLAKNLKEEYDVSVAFGPLRPSASDCQRRDGQSEARESGETGELAKALKHENIACYTIPHLKRNISPMNDIIAIAEIRNLIKKIQPNIIHLNSSKISILGSLATLRVPHYAFHVFYTAHGWVFNEPLSPCKKLFYKYAERFTARFKEKIICVSEHDRQAALREKIAPPKKLITIHNGIAPINFLSREQARRELNLPPDSLIIGSIGNLYKTKGYKYLIKAARIIKNSIPQVAGPNSKFLFVIIGEGEERSRLEALIKKNNLEDTVILAGRIPDAARLLKAFDIYVCSSVKEGLSYTLIEASRAGLPIIATDIGGNPEIIKSKTNRALVPAKDAKSLADQIEKFIKENIQTQISPANSQKKTGLSNPPADKKPESAEFTLDKMIEKTKSVYLEALE